jgi:hypothetical protein
MSLVSFFFQMKYFIILICLFQWASCSVESDKSICAGKRNTTSEPVIKFCDEVGGTLLHRCCRGTDNKTFLAIDLMEANLTTVPDFFNIENLDLHIIDLRDNPNLTISLNGDEFANLTSLNELLLPDHAECPGGSKAWGNISGTTEPEGYDCLDPIDICSNATDLCVEDNSVCSLNGPNHYQCLCTTGYHGYKCLRYGAFPTWPFVGSSVGITIVISVILFWTQRRNVKK